MKYLLDTCTVSFFLKGNSNVINHMRHTKPLDLAISSITLFEIEYGFKLAKSKHLDNLYLKWQQFVQNIKVLDFNKEIALVASGIRASLKKEGKMIGAYDILIAASALESNLICVTNNLNEFERIEKLHRLDWTTQYKPLTLIMNP